MANEGEEPTPFNFNNWSSQFSRNTSKLLEEQELKNLDVLCSLEKEDLLALPLPVGAARQLKNALGVLGNPNYAPIVQAEKVAPVIRPDDEGEDKRDTPEDILRNAGKDLDSLIKDVLTEGNQDAVAQEGACSLTGERQGTSYDPAMRLVIRATGKKVKHIVHFLPQSVKDRVAKKRKEQVEWSKDDQGLVIFKAEENNKLAISQAEWGSANMKVLFSLLKDGELKLRNITDYLAFTAMMHDLATIYEWGSVLEFDVRYRELQVAGELRWGESAKHLEDTVLIKREKNFGQSAPNTKQGRASKDPNELCRLFLGGKCPYGAKCIYKHTKPE